MPATRPSAAPALRPSRPLPVLDRMAAPPPVAAAAPPVAVDPTSYDRVIVFFSGGKDSVACLLHLLECGVARDRIELWHHAIDGREGEAFMDWPCTPAYVAAFARAFGLRRYESWRAGGFERELLRDGTRTAPVRFEQPDGAIGEVGGTHGVLGTRRRFPQVSADLRVRWCSAALKIDVAAAALRNQPRFEGQRTLCVSGERAEESPGRARYATLEPHRTDRRASPRLARHVDHWRPVHRWSAADVWAILERWRVRPHPAYQILGRVSCALCIFGHDAQWATLRVVLPEQFARIADSEAVFGTTIHRSLPVAARADRGTVHPNALDPALAAELRSTTWDRTILLPADEPWVVPAGAALATGGPS